MVQDNAEILARKVKDAIEWTPSNENEAFSERLSKEQAEKNPIIVRKCCRECAFLNPNDTCENFRSPDKIPKREPYEWIPIPRQISESIYCEGWIEAELAELLLRGFLPDSITFGRRHPKIEVPHNGLKKFTKHLKSLPRQKARLKKDVKDIEWPIMDEGLKAILVSVEQRGNEQMWSQYQARLFTVGSIAYINSILDRLVQDPKSKIAEFFRYVIDTHGYYYHLNFSEAHEQGAKTYERILKLLGHQLESIREIALDLLNAIARHSYEKRGPENSTNPRDWREWAKEEFRFAWRQSVSKDQPDKSDAPTLTSPSETTTKGLKRCKKGHLNSPNAKICWKCNEPME